MTALGSPAPLATRRQVLRDDSLDAHLERYGFVTLRLIDADAAALLLEEHGRLHPVPGSGFDADLNNPDRRYRRQVAEILSQALAEPIARQTVAHEPFLWNFLCKWPHDDEQLYLHRDWMFVDERSGARSYSLWIALQDITGHNGQLRVLPGSHRVPSGVTGTNLAPGWIDHRSVIDPRLVTVPLMAGEAVVLNHATVHSSFGNHTEVRRVAVGSAIRPVGEDLVHFWSDESTAQRYRVGPEFFTTYTPAALMDGPPAIADVMPVDDQPVDVSPEALAQMLDSVGGFGRRISTAWQRLRTSRTASGPTG